MIGTVCLPDRNPLMFLDRKLFLNEKDASIMDMVFWYPALFRLL